MQERLRSDAAKLASVDMVIDFTAPSAVLQNIEACLHAGKSMVVGTTGWYGELPRIRQIVEKVDAEAASYMPQIFPSE